MIKKLHTASYRLAALATVGFMSGISDAYAGGGTGFTTATQNINTSVSQFPSLISTMSYIGGCGLGVAGIIKLKQHVDSPGQNALKDALIRLGCGGGLLALPFVLNSMTSTIGTGASVTPFDLPAAGGTP